MNCAIDSARCSLAYVSVGDAAATVLRLGRGSLLAKVDIRNAYRNVPVHPNNLWLLGMEWHGEVYINTVVPFGLRSALKLFNAVADAVEWVLHMAGIPTHPLFVIIGPPGATSCAHNLSLMLGCLEWLGFSVAEEKPH